MFARRAALCVLSGTLLFLSCADFDIWPLCWLAMVPMLGVILDEKCQRPARWGWLCGLCANGGGFYWINHLLMRFGHMPWIAAVPLFLLLVGYQAITFAIFAWALRRLRDRTPVPVTVLAPVIMTALELVVPFLFPWYLAITQAWVPPVIQVAELTGPLGVTFLLVLSNAAIYELVAARRARAPLPWRRAGAAAGVILAALVYGQIRIHQVEARRAAAPHVKVGLVQANIGITEKWAPGLREKHLALHQALSARLEHDGAQLIVWPESAYPYAVERGQKTDFLENDRRRARRGFAAPLLYGALTVGSDSPYPFNTALMMDGDGNLTGWFDKNFLLVFGEYIPWYEHVAWIRKYIPEASNFARGDSVTTFPFTPPPAPGQPLRSFKLGPMICYEDIIPAFGRRLAAGRPNLLVNITNDAWFGATSEPWEHMALSVYRAVEHRLDMVRSVNTGVSAFIDATGKVYKSGPAVDPELRPDVGPVALLDEVAMMEPGGGYLALGDLFGYANLAALLGLGAWARRRAGRPVRLPAILAGLATIAALLLGGALLAAGPEHFGLALSLLAHQPTAEGAGAAAFAIGGWLVLSSGIAAFGGGALVARRFGEVRLEAAAAAVLAFLLPPLLVGRLEGETAGLVFSALGGSALALLGVRVGRRRPGAPS